MGARGDVGHLSPVWLVDFGLYHKSNFTVVFFHRHGLKVAQGHLKRGRRRSRKENVIVFKRKPTVAWHSKKNNNNNNKCSSKNLQYLGDYEKHALSGLTKKKKRRNEHTSAPKSKKLTLLLLSQISLRRSRGSGTLGKIVSLFLHIDS